MKPLFIKTFFLLASIGVLSCSRSPDYDFSTQNLPVFERQVVNFGGEPGNDEKVLRLQNGRLVLKKVTFDANPGEVEIRATLTVRSAGDRWDKSGSCFVLADTSLLTIKDNTTDSINFPEGSYVGKDYAGIIGTATYSPAVELMRFMTPFGVGFYSKENKRKPVYIPEWEKEVVWEKDVSELAQLLNGTFYLGVWIDTWTREGYDFDLALEYTKRPTRQKKVRPLFNNIYYVTDQKIPGHFADEEMTIDFDLEEPLKNVILNYYTTGHGGHSGGDEFVKTANRISFDGKTALDTIPWRDDCASFRRFNPSSGVWLIEDTASYIDFKTRAYTEKVIEERLASSDLSRSNWCPGSQVFPMKIPLGDLSEGRHSIKVSIDAQPIDEEKYNHWLVSGYLVYNE